MRSIDPASSSRRRMMGHARSAFVWASGILLATGSHAQPGPADFIAAVVVRIDRERGTVTLRHAPVPALHLPAATTTLRYIDPRLVLRIRDGDTIQFRADRIDGSLRLLAVFPAPAGARP